jgi:signal transduction histidine kinase
MEYRVRDDKGTERWILDTGLPKFCGKDFAGYVGSAVDVTGLGRARAELSNLSRHLMEEHDRESAAIARKLHEDVCQRIMALTLRLRSVKGAPPDAARQGVVEEIGEQLASLVGELVSVPDPVYQKLDLLGLTTAARRFCEQLSADSAVSIHFQDENVPGHLPTDIALALFRVLQDAVVNAVMHSTARDVWVWLRGSADEIRLEVVDAGVGFDPQQAIPTDGVGLVAIRERVKRVHGGSAVTSRPGVGTRVEAWVPLAPRPI